MLLNRFIDDGAKALEELYPAREARNMVLILCEEILGVKSYTHIVEPEYEIKEKDLVPLAKALGELRKGAPIQYVLGESEFCGLRFKVTPAVLIPRPETELMVREAIKVALRIKRMRAAYGKDAEPVRILDLCTGSGCIAWTLALNIPGAKVVAVDISEEALKVAADQPFSSLLKENQALPPKFLKADILEGCGDFSYGPFDIIVSNPPYIMPSEKEQMRSNVLDYEPPIALFTPEGDPELYYRAVAGWSVQLLAPGGKCFTEINEQLAGPTKEVFRAAGFAHIEVIKDYFDKNRFIFYSK